VWEQLGHLGSHCRTNPTWKKMEIHGKVGSVDPRDQPTWPHHVSRCAFSSDWHVVAYDGSRCMGRLDAGCSGCGPLSPYVEHMAVSD
jgi:hypothetical protein